MIWFRALDMSIAARAPDIDPLDRGRGVRVTIRTAGFRAVDQHYPRD